MGSYEDDRDGKRRFFKPSSTWGEMHESCFLIAIRDPQAVEKMTQISA